MRYRFLFDFRGGDAPVEEMRDCADDAAARAFAAEALLRTPSRTAVDVWRGDHLIYRRRRCAVEPPSPPAA